ncbi:MAG TPA: GIY-YIG nuclease family protein [bacterium]
MCWVYVLYSRKLDRLYIGQTQDLEKRLAEHRQGGSFYTSRSDDWELVYKEEFLTRGGAMLREKELKTGVGREFLRRLLAHGC